MEEHWFDSLNKALVRDSPRRAVLNAAGAIAASLAAGGLGAEAAKDRKKKGKRKGKRNSKGKGKDKKKGKGKDTPKQCGPAIQASCEVIFPPDDVQFCKDKCERCQEAGTEFCIHLPDDEHPDVHATCCPGDEVCCDNVCCPLDRCCEVDGVPRCVAPGKSCCPSDDDGVCQQGTTCCTEGCFACLPPFVLDPVACMCVCPDGQIKCDGACVDGTKCPADGCGGRCAAQGLKCCGNFCYDSAQAECCPPPIHGLCPKSIQHCCSVPGANYCRPHGEPC